MRAHLFALEELASVPLLAEILADLRQRYPRLDTARLGYGLTRRLISWMIEDVVAETQCRLARSRPASVDDVRSAPAPLVGFSTTVAGADRAIKRFLSVHMYRHPRTLRIMGQAQGVVRDLFGHYFARPSDLPAEWASDMGAVDNAARARRVAD